MDNLEDFIKNNRAELDKVEEPESDLIWMGIHSKLLESDQKATIESNPGKQQVGPKMIVMPQTWVVGIAASLLLFLGATIWMLADKETESVSIQITEYLPQIAEQEAEFQQLIAQKEQELDLENLNKVEFSEIFLELQLLEEIRGESLNDLPKYNQQDQLVEVLLKYYERKIRILERLSDEIEKRKKHQKYHEEKKI